MGDANASLARRVESLDKEKKTLVSQIDHLKSEGAHLYERIQEMEDRYARAKD